MDDILVTEELYVELINAINNIYVILVVIAFLMSFYIVYRYISSLRI